MQASPKIAELLAIIAKGDGSALDSFFTDEIAAPPQAKEQTSDLKEQKWRSDEDKKCITQILQSCGCQTTQSAKFWTSVQSILACGQKAAWKTQLLTRVCKAEFADIQGGEIESLVECFLTAGESALAHRAANGDFDVYRVFFLDRAAKSKQS